MCTVYSNAYTHTHSSTQQASTHITFFVCLPIDENVKCEKVIISYTYLQTQLYYTLYTLVHSFARIMLRANSKFTYIRTHITKSVCAVKVH